MIRREFILSPLGMIGKEDTTRSVLLQRKEDGSFSLTLFHGNEGRVRIDFRRDLGAALDFADRFLQADLT